MIQRFVEEAAIGISFDIHSPKVETIPFFKKDLTNLEQVAGVVAKVLEEYG